MRKDDEGFIKPTNEDLDPAVSATISRGQSNRARQQLPNQRRSKAAKQAEIDRKRNRRNIDLPPALEKKINQMADDLGVPFSQLFCRLAYEGLKHLDTETLETELLTSRSMRFTNNLPLPQNGKS